MTAENFLVNKCSNWQAVEAVCEGLPEFDVVSSFAFVIEAVDSVDTGALVVTTKEEEVFREFDFVREKETDSFKRLFATINVITKEQIVGLRRKSAILKHAEQIVVLAVSITTNAKRCLKLEKNWLS
jgi:hypothetical protein